MGRQGIVSGIYDGNRKFTGRCDFAQGGSGLGVQVIKDSQIWYVDKGKTGPAVSGDGLSWDKAFLTITEAIAAAGNYDIIFIAPGFYTEAAELTVTQVGLKIFGLNSSGKTRGPCAMKTPTVAGPMLTIAVNANDVEIAGLGFIATSGHEAIVLGGAATGYVWRPHIHDCAFFGDDVGTYAIGVYGATTTPSAGAFPDCAEAVVENCHFYAWATACASLCIYGTRVMVRNNTLFIIAGATGIAVGTGRPFSEISGNKINGVNSTDVGIRITGDAATWICEKNILLNLSLGVTQDVGIAAIASNNFIHEGTGAVTSVDPTAA